MPHDLANRGDKRPSPLGTSLLVGLRALDPWLQRSLLLSRPLQNMPQLQNLPTPPTSTPFLSRLLSTPASALSLDPFSSIIWAMSVGSALKQIYWVLGLSYESLSPVPAVIISAFNTVHNSLNTLLFTARAANPTWHPYCLYTGALLFTSGILIETSAEIQRRNFKAQPENKGKAYSGGLFGVARNPNYAGYVLWRSGFALAGGGWIWGALLAAFFARDFTTRAIPILEEYCRGRYKDQWVKIEKEVPWRLCPGVY